MIWAEEEFAFSHETGVILRGYPDRVEEDDEGRFLIADYKTKRQIEHVANDPLSCLQVLIYGWLCRQAGIEVSSSEYRYLRKGVTISCRYDEEMEEALGNMLCQFKEAMINCDFPVNRGENDGNCKYCKMRDICERVEEA